MLSPRSSGTPVVVTSDSSRSLTRVQIGGKDGTHDERWLQQLIHRHPTCIPMDQIEPGLMSLMPICMELPVASGFVDNLLMTPEGDIVIAEAKLWGNPQARREVVAQALEYANDLFRLRYEELEAAVLKGEFDGRPKPSRLYEVFGEAETLTERDFVDAVTLNLRNGRMVVLVVGDGIRTDAEALVDGLQSHGGFHFTFSLVELAVFETIGSEDLIVVPRTLAKTYMVERGIVRVDDVRTQTLAVEERKPSGGATAAGSITAEQFYEAMSALDAGLPKKLEAFIDRLSELGVYPEFKRSLNLKWEPPEGKPINLGYILRNGQLWTDAASWAISDTSLARKYVDDLASRFGGEVKLIGKDSVPYVAINGRAPSLLEIADQFDAGTRPSSASLTGSMNRLKGKRLPEVRVQRSRFAMRRMARQPGWLRHDGKR